MIYVVVSPQNKLDRKGRVSGWRHVPLMKDAKISWRTLIAQLNGKGVTSVVSSDLDQEAAYAASDELHVPVRQDYRFRRFNMGRMHAKPLNIVDSELERIKERWLKNPDVPIRDGDSLTSYRKRFFRAIDELIERGESVLFISDPLTLRSMRDREPRNWKLANTGIQRGKIYQVVRQNGGA